jgi:hypothetical protein
MTYAEMSSKLAGPIGLLKQYDIVLILRFI